MNRPTSHPSQVRARIPQVALAVLIAIGAFGFSGAPGIAPVAAAAAPASSRVLTSYLLRSSLSYATGTITTSETITIRNTTGERITSINLSVTPRAFGELVSLSKLRLDDVAVDRHLDEHLKPARRLRAVARARRDGQADAVVRRQGHQHDRDVARGPPVEGERDHAGRALVPDRLRRSQHALSRRLAVDPHGAQDPRRDHDRVDVDPDRRSRPPRQPRRPDPCLRARVRPRLRVWRQPVLQVSVRHRGRRHGPGLVHDRRRTRRP